MDWLKDIPDWLWITFGGLVTSAVVWWRKQSMGLGIFQAATDDEREKLLDLMRERIAYLEERNEQLFEENKVMSATIRAMRKSED